MGKLKYSLISLLAVCLTAGGVFAAWTFSDGIYNSSENVDVGVNSGFLPADRYEFNEVKITFNSGRGEFPNDLTSLSMNNPKSQSIDVDEYNKIFKDFDSYPVVKDQNGNPTAYFSHWVDANKINDDGYHFDEALNEDTTFVAQYVPANNPVLCKKTESGIEKLRYFTINNDTSYSGNEFMISNFIVSAPDRNGWGNQSTVNRSFEYVVLFDSNDDGNLEEFSTLNKLNVNDDDTLETVQNKDYIYNGLYTIFFRAETNNDSSWKIYGGNTFFQRDYNFELVGTPAGSWDVSSPDAPKFGYINTITEYGVEKKVYKINKAYFPKETMVDGTLKTDRNFKIASPYFPGSYGLCNTSSNDTYKHTYKYEDEETLLYLKDSDTTAAANLMIDSEYEYFDIEIKVSYQKINTFFNDPDLGCNIYVFGNIPDLIEIFLSPYKHKIVYDYKNLNNEDVQYIEYVKPGDYSQKYNSLNPYNNSGETLPYPSGKWDVKWIDRDTNASINFSEPIYNNYFVKPTFSPSETLAKTYNLTIRDFREVSSSWSWQSFVLPVFETGTVQQAIDYYKEHPNLINDNAKTAITLLTNPSATKTRDEQTFTFDKYVEESTSSTNLYEASKYLDNKLEKNTTIYLRYKKDNVLYMYNGTHDNSYYYASVASYNETNSTTGISCSSNTAYAGSRLLGYDGIDPASSSVSYNLTSSSGRYIPKYNSSTKKWTIDRVIRVDYSNNNHLQEHSKSIYLWCFNSNSSLGDVWESQVWKNYSSKYWAFTIDYSFTNIIVVSNTSQSWNKTWTEFRQSQDISFTNYTSSKYKVYCPWVESSYTNMSYSWNS